MSSALTRRRLVAAFAVVLGAGAAVGLSGCSAPGKPDVVPSDDDVKAIVTIRVVDNAFEPAEVEVPSGTAVRWVFEGSDQHDVVAEDGSFVSELMYEGSYTHLFVEAGDYPYDCSIHPEMTGVVRVGDE